MAEKPLSLDVLYGKLKVQKSGYISDGTDELIQAGFLARYHTWNVKEAEESKLSRIRVIDNYTRFYFRCIKPNKAAVERGAGRLPASIGGMPGLQFENVILKNRPAVWAQLGIEPGDIVFDNPYWQNVTQKSRGCRIDYMIQCRNNTVYVCEIKFAKAPVSKVVIAEVRKKINCLAKPRNFTFRPVLIHVNGVDEAVMEAGYFDSVIDYGELWR